MVPPLEFAIAAGARGLRWLYVALDGPAAMRLTRLCIIAILVVLGAAIYLGVKAYIKLDKKIDVIGATVSGDISHLTTTEIPDLKTKRDQQVSAIETEIAHIVDVVKAMADNIERQVIVNDRQSDAIGKLAERTSNTEGQVDALRTFTYRQIGARFEHHDPDAESPHHGQTPEPATPRINGK